MAQRSRALGGTVFMMFANAFEGKRVLITGDTGFKGSWLTAWLLKLGANVTGVALGRLPTQPAMFDVLGMSERIRHVVADIRDLNALRNIIIAEQPDYLFHLAAQAIVSTSYVDPVETISTNVAGTMNVLEALRSLTRPCVAVLITSDKCYDNVEWAWGYRETDVLGGKDVYSGSKGAAELVIKCWRHSFFPPGHPVRLAVARAGNVIGGGDWARDRIVADCMRAWNDGNIVQLRCPRATRPWQHVLEPLSGYLTLAHAVAQQPDLHGEAFNFGPRAEQNHTVEELVASLARHWNVVEASAAYELVDDVPFHEAGLLKLNCDKALLELRWEPNLDYAETIEMVGSWYAAYYHGIGSDMFDLTLQQIDSYEVRARTRGRVWAR